MNPTSPEFHDVVTMTGILDADREILLNVGDKELMTICIPPKNRYTRKLCDENFFRNRVVKYFNITNKPTDLTWKKVYVITRLLAELGITSSDSIKFYLANKNTPYFISPYLTGFLGKLALYYGPIGKKLYYTISALLSIRLLSMEIVFRIIIIIKTLNLGPIPNNILDEFIPETELDTLQSLYVNSPDTKTTIGSLEQNIINIYEQELINHNLYNRIPELL